MQGKSRFHSESSLATKKLREDAHILIWWPRQEDCGCGTRIIDGGHVHLVPFRLSATTLNSSANRHGSIHFPQYFLRSLRSQAGFPSIPDELSPRAISRTFSAQITLVEWALTLWLGVKATTLTSQIPNFRNSGPSPTRISGLDNPGLPHRFLTRQHACIQSDMEVQLTEHRDTGG